MLLNKANGIRKAPIDHRLLSQQPHKKSLLRESQLLILTKEICEPSPSSDALMVPPHYSRKSFVKEAIGISISDSTTYKSLIRNMGVKVKFDSGNNLPKCDTCTVLSSAKGTTVEISGLHVSIDDVLRNHRENLKFVLTFYMCLILFYRADRRWDNILCTQSLHFPHEVLMLKFDGMSKCKTQIPTLWSENSKKLAAVHNKMLYHLHAVLIYRKGNFNSKNKFNESMFRRSY